MVICCVHIIDGEREANRLMWLPVMDNRNQAIPNPNTRQISDSKMRCLVKALALFGLGLDVYAGSDIPMGAVDDPIDAEQVELLQGMFKKLPKESQDSYLVWLGIEKLPALPKGKYQMARKQLERKLKAK